MLDLIQEREKTSIQKRPIQRQ